MLVVLMDLTGEGVGVRRFAGLLCWATMRDDTWLKKSELLYLARWCIFIKYTTHWAHDVVVTLNQRHRR